MKITKKLKTGTQVKVRYGAPDKNAWKRGLFKRVSKSGKYGHFVHTKTGKILIRPIDQFVLVDDLSESRMIDKEVLELNRKTNILALLQF